MIFVLDAPVYNLKKSRAVSKGGNVCRLFPESDHVGATQKWLGGQETIYLDNHERLSAIQLMSIADVYDTRDIGERGRQKKYKKKYSYVPPDIFHDGLVVDAVPKTANSYSIYKENGKMELNLFLVSIAGVVRVEFQLLKDFIFCTRKITNPELLGLFSGMRRIEGGRKLWRESILNNPLINNRHIAIKDWFNNVMGKGKNPWEQLISYYAPNDPAGGENITDLPTYILGRSTSDKVEINH